MHKNAGRCRARSSVPSGAKGAKGKKLRETRTAKPECAYAASEGAHSGTAYVREQQPKDDMTHESPSDPETRPSLRAPTVVGQEQGPYAASTGAPAGTRRPSDEATMPRGTKIATGLRLDGASERDEVRDWPSPGNRRRCPPYHDYKKYGGGRRALSPRRASRWFLGASP